jgi:hypothetical protein
VQIIEGRTFRGSLPADEDVRYLRCVLDNLGHRNATVSNVEFVDCAFWSVGFSDVIFEDCLIENLKTRLPGQTGARTMPVFFWGCLARHLTIRGTVGGFMWNPPRTPTKVKWSAGRPGILPTGQVDFGESVISRAESFYKEVDWALDISQARFRSVPTFAFGPPGELVLRDPTMQPLVTRQIADSIDWKALRDRIGIWSVVLSNFQQRPWPKTTVLIPGLGGPKAKVERELAGLAYLSQSGMTLD